VKCRRRDVGCRRRHRKRLMWRHPKRRAEKMAVANQLKASTYGNNGGVSGALAGENAGGMRHGGGQLGIVKRSGVTLETPRPIGDRRSAWR